MTTNLTKENLIDFENSIVNLYNEGRIKSPIHLRGGNEQILIDIFNKENINDNCWLACNWASHLECLCKGVSKEELTEAILQNRSITLCFNKYKIISSAIVASIAPIATGIALGIKRKNLNERVFCFLGDMSFLNGIAQESIRYSQNHNLPIKFIVADNKLSVQTPTYEVWGLKDNEIEKICKQFNNVIYYNYVNSYPHSGTGKFVKFW